MRINKLLTAVALVAVGALHLGTASAVELKTQRQRQNFANQIRNHIKNKNWEAAAAGIKEFEKKPELQRFVTDLNQEFAQAYASPAKTLPYDKALLKTKQGRVQASNAVKKALNAAEFDKALSGINALPKDFHRELYSAFVTAAVAAEKLEPAKEEAPPVPAKVEEEIPPPPPVEPAKEEIPPPPPVEPAKEEIPPPPPVEPAKEEIPPPPPPVSTQAEEMLTQIKSTLNELVDQKRIDRDFATILQDIFEVVQEKGDWKHINTTGQKVVIRKNKDDEVEVLVTQDHGNPKGNYLTNNLDIAIDISEEFGRLDQLRKSKPDTITDDTVNLIYRKIQTTRVPEDMKESRTGILRFLGQPTEIASAMLVDKLKKYREVKLGTKPKTEEEKKEEQEQKAELSGVEATFKDNPFLLAIAKELQALEKADKINPVLATILLDTFKKVGLWRDVEKTGKIILVRQEGNQPKAYVLLDQDDIKIQSDLTDIFERLYKLREGTITNDVIDTVFRKIQATEVPDADDRAGILRFLGQSKADETPALLVQRLEEFAKLKRQPRKAFLEEIQAGKKLKPVSKPEQSEAEKEAQRVTLHEADTTYKNNPLLLPIAKELQTLEKDKKVDPTLANTLLEAFSKPAFWKEDGKVSSWGEVEKSGKIIIIEKDAKSGYTQVFVSLQKEDGTKALVEVTNIFDKLGNIRNVVTNDAVDAIYKKIQAAAVPDDMKESKFGILRFIGQSKEDAPALLVKRLGEFVKLKAK